MFLFDFFFNSKHFTKLCLPLVTLEIQSHLIFEPVAVFFRYILILLNLNAFCCTFEYACKSYVLKQNQKKKIRKFWINRLQSHHKIIKKRRRDKRQLRRLSDFLDLFCKRNIREYLLAKWPKLMVAKKDWVLNEKKIIRSF